MNIYEVYLAVNFELNKSQRGNAFSMDEFNNRLKVLDMDYLKLKMGLPEEYGQMAKLPRQAWENSHKVTEDTGLKVRMGKDTPPMFINQFGIGQMPDEYLHISTVYNPTTLGDVEILNDDDFSGRLGTRLKKPTVKNPICRIIDKSLEVEPKTIRALNVTYLRKPIPAFLDYTIVNDVEVYLESGQVHNGTVLTTGTASRTSQLDWADQTHSDIINLLVGYGSRNLRDNANTQFSEQRKQKGI
jgi:hypothetical protein